MTTPTWQAGTLYSPGAIVQRSSAPAVVAQPPVNADFESGDIGWTKESPWTVGTFDNTFTGAYSARCNGVKGTFRIYNETPVPVSPGMSVTASCMVRRADGNMKGQVQLEWLDSLNASLEIVDGTLIDYSEDKWKTSTVTSTAPAGAAYMRIGAKCVMNRTDANLHVDSFQWNYAYSPPIDALVFTAVQADAGYSGATEPVWPSVLGEQVVDNEVIWEAIDSSTVTWEAAPILVSGPTEPIFPTAIGDTVSDNTIVWTAISRRVEDEKCPNGPIAVMAASKIFCADDDIIAFCATVNPLDWTSSDDAGYLPFGLQAYGTLGGVTALGLYRGNLIAFNGSAFQMWQVDPDPQAMALLDSAPIGCTYPRTLRAFQNDLIFLSPAGVRNISIAGASTNLQAGGMGEPVDPLVRAFVEAGEYEPHAVFIPQFGQYWLIFGPDVLVMTVNGVKHTTWSRYTFAEPITDTTLLQGVLYLRMESGAILRLDTEEVADDVYCQPAAPVLSGSYYGGITDLSWTAVTADTGIDAYIVLRSVNGSYYVELDRVDGETLTYSDGDIELGLTYSYRIVAVPGGDWINSPPSNIYTPSVTDVYPPPVLSGYLNEGNDGVLSWTASGTAVGTITAYNIYRQDDEGGFVFLDYVDGDTLTYTDPALEAEILHQYYVVAVASTGYVSDPSNTVELSYVGEDAANAVVFTADGTWTKPAGAVMIEVVAMGGGGGGCAGQQSPTGGFNHGYGGGGGGYSRRYFLADSLPATVPVTVGQGGSGGATSGGFGSDGGDSVFGDVLRAVGGGGANLSGANTGVGGGGLTCSGGRGSQLSSNPVVQTNYAGQGGGSGGRTTGAIYATTAGGVSTKYIGSLTGGAGGTPLSSGDPGDDGQTPVMSMVPGTGAGGGAGKAGPAGEGGAGGRASGGGGGGSGSPFGAGGDGGNGVVVVISYG